MLPNRMIHRSQKNMIKFHDICLFKRMITKYFVLERFFSGATWFSFQLKVVEGRLCKGYANDRLTYFDCTLQSSEGRVSC